MYQVFELLLRRMALPGQAQGVMVDGFPRTVVQVELLRRLHERLAALSRVSDSLRPRFRICILYVDEHESVRRQLKRGRHALTHNEEVAEGGEGELVEVRQTPTNLSVHAMT